MADNRITSTGASKVPTPAKPLAKSAPTPAAAAPAADTTAASAAKVSAKADSTIATNLGTGNLHDIDALIEQAVANAAPATPAPAAPAAPAEVSARSVIESALKFPPQPRGAAEKKAWTLDAYSRLLKAETAAHGLQSDLSAKKVDSNTYSKLRQMIWSAEDTLRKADPTGALKTEFFNGVLPPAQALIDGLADYPAPPADRAGKQAWLDGAKQKLAEARVAEQLHRDAWFTFQAVPFDHMADTSHKLWDFESKIRNVGYDLNPPAPRPRTPGQPGTSTGSTSGQIFGNTQGVANALNNNPNNPIVQVGGAIALPLALTVDLLDLLSGNAFRHSSSDTTVTHGKLTADVHTEITVTRVKK